MNEQTLYAKVTTADGETVRIDNWQFSSYTGAPVDNRPADQPTKIF
jgi:hypothetical protein